MLKITVTEGRSNRSAFKSLKQLPARTRRGIVAALQEEGIKLVRDTGQGFEETKTGNVTRVYVSKKGKLLKRGRWHTASTRTQTPAVLSGALKRSLGFVVKGKRTLIFGADTPYAGFHERSGRTYLKRSINNRAQKIHKTLERCIKRRIISQK